jgi:hypothetical protein
MTHAIALQFKASVSGCPNACPKRWKTMLAWLRQEGFIMSPLSISLDFWPWNEINARYMTLESIKLISLK